MKIKPYNNMHEVKAQVFLSAPPSSYTLQRFELIGRLLGPPKFGKFAAYHDEFRERTKQLFGTSDMPLVIRILNEIFEELGSPVRITMRQAQTWAIAFWYIQEISPTSLKKMGSEDRISRLGECIEEKSPMAPRTTKELTAFLNDVSTLENSEFQVKYGLAPRSEIRPDTSSLNIKGPKPDGPVKLLNNLRALLRTIVRDLTQPMMDDLRNGVKPNAIWAKYLKLPMPKSLGPAA
jgi:hypothetical protein